MQVNATQTLPLEIWDQQLKLPWEEVTSWEQILQHHGLEMLQLHKKSLIKN